MRAVAIEVVTPPETPIVTVEEFIDHARLNALTVDRQPELIARELAAATERAQSYLRRSLITQGVRALFIADGLSCACARMMVLPRPPVISVQKVTSGGRDLAADEYRVEMGIVYAAGALGETATVEYTAGYGETAETVPPLIREGILEYATVIYEARAGERDQKYQASAGRTLPAGVVDCWRPFQVELSG